MIKNQNAMRVTHVTGFYQEGLGYEENYLGFFQVSSGADVSIITSTLPLATWQGRDQFQTEKKNGINKDFDVSIYRLEAIFQARNGTQVFFRNMRNTIKEIDPHIMHIHGPVGMLTFQALMAARGLDIPVVIDNHLCYFNLRPYTFLKQFYYHQFGRIILRSYDSLVGRYLPLTADCEKVLHDELGIPYERMTHTTLGADTQVFKYQPAARKRLREQFGIPMDAPVITFVGRIGPEKKIDVLITAWNRLALRHGAYLVLIGPLTKQVEVSLLALVDPKLKNMLKITGHVQLLELPGYISLCDIGVWPARPGISVIQAMSCQLAIVSAEPEAIGHLMAYGNGEFFPHGDENALVETLDSILGDRDRLKLMRQQSRRLAEDIFDWRVVASRTNKIYAEVLTGKDMSIPPIWGKGGSISSNTVALG